MTRVAGHVGVEREGARLIGAELDRCRAASRNTPRHAVFLDGQAVGEVGALHCELDEVVLTDLNPIG